jgi:hypothetical protein
MALDTVHHRAFSACRSGVLAVSDYQAGKILAAVPIGSGVDGAGYDAASGSAFASNADGTLTVIHQDTPDQYHVVENVQTQASRMGWIRRITVSTSSRRNSLPRRRAAAEGDRQCCRGHFS